VVFYDYFVFECQEMALLTGILRNRLTKRERPELYSLIIPKEKNIMEKHFSRHIDSNIIEELMSTDLWTKKLSMDCLHSNVFFAIRPDNCISFYHKGGGLFEFEKSKGFSTDVKYAVAINESVVGKIYENHLSNAKLINSFLDGYDRIKKNCEHYLANTEAQGVSYIYHKYPFFVLPKPDLPFFGEAYKVVRKLSATDCQ